MTTVKELTCSDAPDFSDCAFRVRNEDEDQLIELARLHVEKTHGDRYRSMADDDIRGLMKDVEFTPKTA